MEGGLRYAASKTVGERGVPGGVCLGAVAAGRTLGRANLQEAILMEANLQEAMYEPHPGKLPNFWTLADPDNKLETLLFYRSPAALIALREAFKRGGMRTQERQVTYAIEHIKRLQAWNPSWFDPEAEDPRPWLEQLAGKSESLFSYVLFELPSGYGMVPSRALATHWVNIEKLSYGATH
jgi:hypothetical protein